MKHTYYPALDGLRTIAVGIVLCAHGGVTYFRSGGVGVDIFFVLSGFLITTILITEQGRTGSINFRNFYARRFLRLAPALVLACALAAIGTVWLEGRFPGSEIAFSLSYTANWVQAFYGYHLGSLNHTWSLAVEEQFYVIWPVIMLGLCKLAPRSSVRVAVLLTGAAAIALYRAAMVGTYTDERINFGLDTRMDALMLGAALACLVGGLPGGRLPDVAGKWLGRVVAPLMLVALLSVPNIVTWYSPWMGWIGYVLVGGAAALVVLDLVAGGHSRLGRVLAARPFVFIGRISYGVYLYHLPVYYAVEKLIPGESLAVRLTVKLVLTFALAIPSFYLVEQRFLKLKSRFEAGEPGKLKNRKTEDQESAN